MDNNQMASQIGQVFNNMLQAKIAARVEQRVHEQVQPRIKRLEEALVKWSDLDVRATAPVMVAREELRKAAGIKEAFKVPADDVGPVCQMKVLNDTLWALSALIEDSIRASIMKEEVTYVVNRTLPGTACDESCDCVDNEQPPKKAVPATPPPAPVRNRYGA